jgi:hypothetical protein
MGVHRRMGAINLARTVGGVNAAPTSSNVYIKLFCSNCQCRDQWQNIYPFVQLTPFSVKLVGRGLLLPNVPLKPIAVDAPAASELFHARPVAVTC